MESDHDEGEEEEEEKVEVPVHDKNHVNENGDEEMKPAEVAAEHS